jgi:hypothetical protein
MFKTFAYLAWILIGNGDSTMSCYVNYAVGSRVTARVPLAEFTWRGLPTPGKNPCLAFGLLAYSLFDIPLFSMLPCNEQYITLQYVHT